MGESDLQAVASQNHKSTENINSDINEKTSYKEILTGHVQSLLKNGKVHDALSAYIQAYSSDFLDSDCLEIFVDGVVEKARKCLSENMKLSLHHFLCAECCDVIRDPVTLKCGHTFSKKCILVGTKSESFECKTCGKSDTITYLSQLKNNVTISALVEKFMQTLYSESKQNTLAAKREHSLDKICDPEKYLINRRDEMVSNMEPPSAVHLTCSPMSYFKKGDILVNLGKYEEAVGAYLICFTLDPTAIQAKEIATRLFHKLLLKYPQQFCLQNGCTDDLSIKNAPLMQRKVLAGSDGSLSSAESTDSYLVAEDDSSSSDNDETKDWNGLQWNEFAEGNTLHMIVDKFFNEIEKISEEKNLTTEINIPCLDKREFECPLCMRILWEPITTPCGHTFCRVCLNRCFDHQPTCPLCKTSLAALLAERVQNITEFLELAIKTLLPDDYAERKAVYLEEMEELSNAGKDPEHVIPLFVCTIAYPTVPCPLHVFEPRYRLMIRQCMESGSRQFGMCAYIDDNIAEYGTMLEIRDVQYFPDGRSVVDTIGSRRFRILRKGERDGYHTGAVEFLKDETLIGVNLQDVRETHDRVYKISQAWFMRLPSDMKSQILQHFGPMPPVETNYISSPNGPSWFWWMLAVLPLEPRSQLMILSMTSLPRRLNTLYRVLLHLQSTIVT